AYHRGRIRFRATVYAVRISYGRNHLPRLQPIAIKHRLAGIGRAHHNVRAFDHRLRTAHWLNFDVQQLGHFFSEAVTVLFGTTVDLHPLDGPHATDGF